MTDFPRTQIEDLSVPRMLIGTNWFLGYSHQSQAKDNLIKEHMTRQRIADVLEVFMKAGIDAIYGTRPDCPHLSDAVKDAQDRTGRKMIQMGTPTFRISRQEDQFLAGVEKTLDSYAEIGIDVCLPHQDTTDLLADQLERKIHHMPRICQLVRRRGMIPGLSTHTPYVPVYADESQLDVGTYVQMYNAAGFLMQIEIDWVHRMIWKCSKPVITIKPFAAGRLHPLAGLAFGWSTLRQQDMICVGTMTPDEARELIDISWSIFENRQTQHPLQWTRSKANMQPNRPAQTDS